MVPAKIKWRQSFILFFPQSHKNHKENLVFPSKTQRPQRKFMFSREDMKVTKNEFRKVVRLMVQDLGSVYFTDILLQNGH